jgi:RNA polymerase sigma factor (sigma-70 family)
MSSMTPADILARVLNLRAPVRSYLNAHIWNEQERGDVEQTVWIKVLRDWQTFVPEDETHRRRRVMRIAVNCVQDYIRARMRRARREQALATEQEPEAPRPEDWSEEFEHRRHLVSGWLQELPGQERKVMMHLLSGSNEEEVAADLGTTVNNVRVVRTRATARLRERAQTIVETDPARQTTQRCQQ